VPPTATPTNTPAAPVANNDSYTITQDTPLILAAPGLLGNDSNSDSRALTANLVSNPGHGSVTLNANGGFSYLPASGFVGTDSFTYQANNGQAISNVATVNVTVVAGGTVQPPFGLTYSAAVELVGAPCSVAPNVLEDNSFIRLFPERLSYPLPSAVTVTASDGTTKTLAAGTLVDSFYLHADWVNQGQNTAKVFDGNVTFAQPVLGVIKSGTGLLNTHAILGAPGTTYATNTDQGIETYDDSVSFSNGGKTVNLHLTVWSTADEIRVLTPARSAITPSGAVTVVGAPCSVVEGALESDSAIRLFAERQNYVLPAAVTVDAQGLSGAVLPQGARVNVYYVHADPVGNGQGKQLRGSVTFNTPVLAVLTDSGALLNTHNTLGNTWHPTIKTAYSTSSDQGIEADDSVTVNAQQKRVDFVFNGSTGVDQVRIITAATPGTATVTAAAVNGDTVAAPSTDPNSVPSVPQLVNHVFLPLINK